VTPSEVTFIRSVRTLPGRIAIGPVATNPPGVRFWNPTALVRNGGAERVLVVRLVDSVGVLVSADTIENVPEVREDVVGRSRAVGSDGMVTVYLSKPFGSVAMRAMSPRGDLATATSGRYLVRLRRPNGSEIVLGDSSTSGPLLSQEDRQEAEEIVRDQTRSVGIPASEHPYGVPERKSPVAGLEFDRESRLWVYLSVSGGSPLMADVYAVSGDRLARVAWPKDWSLVLGTVGPHGVLAIRERADGVQEFGVIGLEVPR